MKPLILIIISFLVAALAVTPKMSVAAMEDATKVREPSTPWKVDYAQNECRLLRTFGSGTNAVTMRLARGSGLDSFDFVLAGASVPRLPKELKINFALEPQAKSQEVDAYSLGVPGRSERFIRWPRWQPVILIF